VSLCAAATSAQPVASAYNRQVQNSSLDSDVTLEAVDPDGFDVVAGGEGNAYGTGEDGVSVDLDSAQALDGDVIVFSAALITGDAPAGSVTTTASGNAGSAFVYGGNLRGTVDQVVEGGRTITADARLVQGPNGAIGDAEVTTTAVANNQEYGVTGGWVETETSQSSGASVIADGSAAVQQVDGTIAFVSTAVGNNLTSAADQGSSDLRATQRQTGGSVLGATFVTAPRADTVVAISTASANNVVATDASGPMAVDVSQQSASYVRSQTGVNTAEFGSVVATSAGAANAVIATNLGLETTFTVDQTASGGVDAITDFTGQDGYDALVQATAHGNVVSASASVAGCLDCVSTFTASSSQTNNDNVAAYAASAVGGRQRSTMVSAGAVGNSASYYVTRPGS